MTRAIGTIVIDDNVNCITSHIIPPSPRDLQTSRIFNRYGRAVRVKEDAKVIDIDVRGWYRDFGGKYFHDWKAALLGQSRVNFTIGGGKRYESVDVLDVAETPVALSREDSATPDSAWAWVMKVRTYEPYARETAPTLQNLGALATGAGSNSTSLSVNCAGTAFSEPTWQFTLVVPGGVTCSRVQLQNVTSGETCTVNFGTPLTTGTWWLLMDASGGIGVASGTPSTPGNNQYSLLSTTSLGWGCTLQLSTGGAADQDYTGRVPTLVQSTAPSVPPTSFANSITAVITATAALTSANLSVVAPARYLR